MNYGLTSPIHKISVSNGCKIKIMTGGQTLEYIEVYTYVMGSSENLIATLKTNPSFLSLPGRGDYYLVVSLQRPAVEDRLAPYSLTITTFCDSLCVNPNNPTPQLSCAACGDGILD